MQQTNQYLSNTRFGIDKNVLATMFVIGVLAVGLLAFKLTRKETCSPFSITSASVSSGKSVDFYIGDPVNFTAMVESDDQVAWDFGDHTPDDIGNTARHIYTRDGNYTITATVNGNDNCKQTVALHIKPVVMRTGTESGGVLETNPIIGQDAPTAGIPASYTCTVKAKMYEWSILNSPIYPAQNTETAGYNFIVQGPQILELKLDGDPTKVYRKQINVLAAPPPAINTSPGGGSSKGGGSSPVSVPPVLPPVIPVDMGKKEDPKKEDPVIEKKPEEPKPKMIVADEVFRMRFEAVARGEINAAGFDDVLCNGGGTRVLVENDNNKWETVAGICQLFYRNKKIKKIWDVVTERDSKNCVTLIRLKYKKGGFL
ncbi:MAG: PKD domain-containing protein [Chitinophagaceae bacterium]